MVTGRVGHHAWIPAPCSKYIASTKYRAARAAPFHAISAGVPAVHPQRHNHREVGPRPSPLSWNNMKIATPPRQKQADNTAHTIARCAPDMHALLCMLAACVSIALQAWSYAVPRALWSVRACLIIHTRACSAAVLGTTCST